MTNSERERDSSVMMSSVMPSEKYCCSGSPLMLVKGSTAIDGLSGRDGAGRDGCGRYTVSNPEHAHRIGDVLELDVAHVLEDMARLAAHFVAHLGRDADAAWFRQRLQPRGDVDAVAVDVRALADDVAKIDADAQNDAPVLGQQGVGFGHFLLQFERRLDRVHRTGELHQHAVAHDLDDPALVAAHDRLQDRSFAAPSARRAFPPRQSP